jgi:hypothetical protein
MAIAPKKLAVTAFKGGSDDPNWTGYEVRNGRAHVVCEYHTLDVLRDYATAAGYAGIRIGAYRGGWA